MATSINVNPRFVSNICNGPNEIFPPITGYEQVTVNSLYDACEPIKDLIDYACLAQTGMGKPPDGLSEDECASIQLFTMEWEVQQNSFYMILNRTLCLEDRTKLQPWFKYLKLFLTALSKLPPNNQKFIWHGVGEDVSARYPEGKEIVFWEFTSCTYSIEVLDSPKYLRKFNKRTIFAIETNSGKCVRRYSYHHSEDEILLPPGIRFKVGWKLNPIDGVHVIQLCEISSPYFMLTPSVTISSLE